MTFIAWDRLAFLLCVLSLLGGSAISNAQDSKDYECPKYADIRQPSVDPSLFDIANFAGTWYMIATNEPTLPDFCICAVNEYTVDVEGGWYGYTNTANCKGHTIKVPIKGELSDDPTEPGNLRENFGPMNTTLPTLDPNMVFSANYNNVGNMTIALTYACLGRLPIQPLGHPKFSFNVLSRSNDWEREDIQRIIDNANDQTGGLLDVTKIRMSDSGTYASCGY